MKKNSNTQPLLFEIGTEELPTKAVKALSESLCSLMIAELQTCGLNFKSLKSFATPRRLGFIITELDAKQADYTEEKRGPSLKAAYDQDNKFTKAALGFANSVGCKPEKLDKLYNDSNTEGWLVYKNKITGRKTEQLLPEILANIFKKLPIAKPMRWANYDYSFIRPVHWLVLMYGDKNIKVNLFGINSSNKTYGHRFLANKAIVLKSPMEYEKKLHKAYVIANFDERLKNINTQVIKAATSINKQKLNALITPELLTEVTSLVEWPVALVGEFDKKFLEVPQECLITSMVANQKYFAVTDNKNVLQPYFIFVSNIVSKNKKQVILGNQKVLTARLSDAQFFYNNDKNKPLDSNISKLANVIYQQKLGTLLDKTGRIKNLSDNIAKLIEKISKAKINHAALSRAADLAKADLNTEMVYEFPELQGIMGKYYAIKDGENALTADALEQYYWPKFAGDKLPESVEACCLAIADKLDTLVGIFAIDQKPTGDKDPFGLRRSALGILRILIEKELPLDLKDLINLALENFKTRLNLEQSKRQLIIDQCLQFCFERLKKYYLDQNISINIFYAVSKTNTTSPLDFNQRMQAANDFLTLPEANNLIAANKRVRNILNKQDLKTLPQAINNLHLKESAEVQLHQVLTNLNQTLLPLFSNQDYKKILFNLASLQKPIDDFFESVMVNSEDLNLKNNRLLLLKNIQGLFNQVADISELQ